MLNPAPVFKSLELIYQGERVLHERISYESDGLTVNGLVCRPNNPGRFPILMYQHAGFSGLRADWEGKGLCHYMADRGYAVFMSSFRGEDGSQGPIEFCAGEVNDSLRLHEIARAQPYVVPDLVALLGISHGGCISWQMIARGLNPLVIVDIFGPKDWLAMYDYASANALPGSDSDFAQFVANANALVGPPSRNPQAYISRSPTYAAARISQYTGAALVVHGAKDDTVPTRQSCDFVRVVGGFRLSHLNRRYVPRLYERTTTAHPPSCGEPEMVWFDGSHPGRDDWQENRNFVVYDEMGHTDGIQLPYAIDDAENFIRTRMPGGRRD